MSELIAKQAMQALGAIADTKAAEHLEAQLSHETKRDVIVIGGRQHSAALWLAVAGVPAIQASLTAQALPQPYQKHYMEGVEREMEAQRKEVQERVFTNEQREWNARVEARKQAKKARKQK